MVEMSICWIDQKCNPTKTYEWHKKWSRLKDWNGTETGIVSGDGVETGAGMEVGTGLGSGVDMHVTLGSGIGTGLIRDTETGMETGSEELADLSATGGVSRNPAILPATRVVFEMVAFPLATRESSEVVAYLSAT